MKELFVSLKNPFFSIEKKGFFDGKRGENDINIGHLQKITGAFLEKSQERPRHPNLQQGRSGEGIPAFSNNLSFPEHAG